MKFLAPIKHPVGLIDLAEKKIAQEMYHKLFKPLFSLLAKETVANDINVVLAAIRRGDLTFKDGLFVGKFNAEITAELKAQGAVWVQERAGFLLPTTRITAEFTQAVALAKQSRILLAHKIDATLQRALQKLLASNLTIGHIIDKAYAEASQRFNTNVKRVTVSPKLTPEELASHTEVVKEQIKLKYSGIARKYSQRISDDAYAHAMQGGRRDELQEMLEHNYGMASNQAKFVAKNELNRSIAAFNQARYQAAGIKKYKWVCVHMPKDKSPDQHTVGNVRYFHGLLDRTIQRWDEPPIVNRNPDIRAHPKETWNCRCNAIPVFEGES